MACKINSIGWWKAIEPGGIGWEHGRGVPFYVDRFEEGIASFKVKTSQQSLACYNDYIKISITEYVNQR